MPTNLYTWVVKTHYLYMFYYFLLNNSSTFNVHCENDSWDKCKLSLSLSHVSLAPVLEIETILFNLIIRNNHRKLNNTNEEYFIGRAGGSRFSFIIYTCNWQKNVLVHWQIPLKKPIYNVMKSVGREKKINDFLTGISLFCNWFLGCTHTDLQPSKIIFSRVFSFQYI